MIPFRSLQNISIISTWYNLASLNIRKVLPKFPPPRPVRRVAPTRSAWHLTCIFRSAARKDLDTSDWCNRGLLPRGHGGNLPQRNEGGKFAAEN